MSSRLPGARLKDIFPSGFDERFGQGSSIGQCASISSNRRHFSSTPEQLYYWLIERYNPDTPTESIIVKAAWYGKQTKSAQHEFIAIQVEDVDVPGLTNYLILDRNAETPQASSNASSSQTTNASDKFKVSYDGKVEKLLQECRLTPYRFLEKLSFPSTAPLHLYELVTLAGIVSSRHPNYRLLDSSCYLFAGVIWECMRLMRPTAIYQDDLAKKRGKCRWFRYIPSDSERQEAFKEVQSRLPSIERLWGHNKRSTDLEWEDEHSEEHE